MNFFFITDIAVLLVEETVVTEKTNDLSQVTDKLYQVMFYRKKLPKSGIRTHSFSGDTLIA